MEPVTYFQGYRPDETAVDDANRRLVANVHPADWKNPLPTGRYNLVVIGGGSAGMVAAIGAAGLGAKVALIDGYADRCRQAVTLPAASRPASSRCAATAW